MDFQAVVRRRKMVRSFSHRPVPDKVLDQILANALQAPSAGFSQGWAFVVMVGDETTVFWDTVSDPDWRAAPEHPGLLRAPVVIIPLTDEATYRARYHEPDKMAHHPDSTDAWPVPYWLVDTSFATMVILLSAVDAGLGALFFGLNHRDEEVMTALGVPGRFRPIGAVALGWPDGGDHPSPSLARGHRPVESVVHRGRWSS